ncbi:sugar phosphate isomerase/epimerase family protein [Subtercola vilae]|uniref:Sugar phosphate isomerase/epimerase n=1 Tax=Subtercola vilae TaxID=2056433 RepID=A0A4T2BS61_9MICO|nr:sugar phosphate isomerase/epimerase [Subtercola vilae]TIH33879.1 sugar phosphate isomerase/epimerase [Subtercola vilae]
MTKPSVQSLTKPSVQLYSIRDAVDENIDRAIERLAEIGFASVEPYAFHLRIDDYKRAFAAAGVTAPSGHAATIDAPDASVIFDAAAELEISLVIDPFIPTERWQSVSSVQALADRVNALAEQAAERGLQFGYHNHQWEFVNRINGRPAYEIFLDLLTPNVALEVDTFWATVGSADAPALLRQLGDRVQALHIKDGKISEDIATILPSSEDALVVPAALKAAFENQTPAGQGDVDVIGVLRAAPHALRVVEFDAYSGDVFAGIAESFAWLKQNDAEVTA